ncbi:MAG: hypothetical protein PF484_15125 [Bacteroidales bacterium]|nr:hypothetical protein [Bacteroidales bacterium]
MKNYLKLSAIVFSLLLFTSACEKFKRIPKTGEPFYRAQSMKYYFSNELGDDLLIPEDSIIKPIAFEDKGDSLFFQSRSRIDYDNQLGNYYWKTGIFGRQGYINYQFYIKISETDVDTLTVKFRYTTEGLVGGGTYANIDKLYYNETLIRSGENTSSEFIPERIFIMKDNERTLVSVEK